MTKRKEPTTPVMPATEFDDLAAAFANPAKAPASPPPAAVVSGPQQAQVPSEGRRPRGRPRAPEELVNQTLSIRADQLQRLHQLAAAEYARLGRRVLPSEVVRALLDLAIGQIRDDKVLG